MNLANEMPEIVMPDQSSPAYPAEFRFSATIESYYRSLPRALRRNWDLFGSDTVADVPQKPGVGTVEGAAGAHIKPYAELVTRLEQRFLELQDMDRRVAESVRNSVVATRSGRAEIEAVVHRVNRDAGAIPVGMSKGEHILGSLSAGLDRVDQVVGDTTRDQQAHAAVMADLSTRVMELAQRPRSTNVLEPPVATGHNRSRPRMRMSGGGDDPALRGDTPAVRPLQPPRSATPIAAATAAVPPMVETGAESIPAHVNFPDTGTTRRNALVNSMRGDMGQGPRSVASTRIATEGRLADRVAAPVPAATTDAATPWGRRTGGTSSDLHASVASSSKRAEVDSPARSRTPSAQELVRYVFPDGRTQEVTSAVARALDAAFDDRWGTGGRSASARARAARSEDYLGDARPEPHSVVTGDVAVWAQHCAVLVVFDAGDDRRREVEVIVDGRLRPFSTRMSDRHGEFGPFDGFRRPHHAESGTDSTAAIAGAAPRQEGSTKEGSPSTRADLMPSPDPDRRESHRPRLTTVPVSSVRTQGPEGSEHRPAQVGE